MRSPVRYRKISISQSTALGIYYQTCTDTTTGNTKHILAIDLTTSAHAQLAQDATVEVKEDVWVGRIHLV